MPWEIIRDDIANLHIEHIDAVVNLPHLTPGEIGTGVDSAIHKKAGPKLKERLYQQGNIEEGDAFYTNAYELSNYLGTKLKCIIHTRGPLWKGGGYDEADILRKCYDRSLEIARSLGCKSIAFPLISSGNRSMPVSIAYRIATDAFRDYCNDHDMRIYLVIFDEKTFDYCKRQQSTIPEKIDKTAVHVALQEEYSRGRENIPPEITYSKMMDSFIRNRTTKDRIDQIIDETEGKSVFVALARIVDYITDAENISEAKICRKGNLDSRHFSNNVRPKSNHQNPTDTLQKHMLLAYAIALQLNFSQTKKLLTRGGHVFPYDLSDEIVCECISQEIYDIYKVNERLNRQNQRVLGSVRTADNKW